MSPFNTALLHCLKYSGQDVYGLLLSSSKDPEACLPLVHTPCVTMPLLRTALSIVDEIEGMKIVGIYYAANNSEDKGLSPVAKWIHAQLCSTLKTDSILVWKYSQVEIGTGSITKCPFVPYAVENDKEVIKSGISAVFDGPKFKEGVSNHEYLEVYDFEDHLSDPSREWIQI